MKPMLEIQLSGILVRYQHDGRHKKILAKVAGDDLRLVRGTGWVITRPEKYTHIPEVAELARDYQAQLTLPGTERKE